MQAIERAAIRIEDNPLPSKTHSGRRTEILIGLLMTLGVANLPLGRWGERLFGGYLGGEVLWWLAVAVALLYVALIERKSLTSIGARALRFRDFVFAAATGLAMIIAITLAYAVLFPILHLHVNTNVMNSILSKPLWYRFLLVTRAAVAEEVLFRGYPIPRITELTGSRLLACVVSCAAFTLAHLSSWGIAQLLVAALGGLLLTVLFVLRRNLCSNVLAHWIADGAGFLLPH